jgi:hypothetical protein
MHVKVAHVGVGWFLLLVSAKPDEPIVVQKHPQRVHARHQHVQPQVELESVNQEWFLQVLLHHTLLFVHTVDLFPGAHQVNAFALRRALGFHDEKLFFAFLLLTCTIIFKIFELLGQ